MLTEVQREQRKAFIGGSDAPVVMGLPVYGRSRYQLYLEKRGELPPEPGETPEHIELGNELEDSIARLYMKRTSRKVEVVGTVIHPEYPWMGVNMDRLIVSEARGPGYLEIKNFGYWHGKDIHSMNELPDDVFVQVQHGLEVARKSHGVEWGSVAILIGGQRLFWCDLERHEELIAILIEAEREFMELVKAGTPPSDEGVSEELIKRLYPKDNGKTLQLDHPEITRLAHEIVEWDEKCGTAEEELNKRKTAMKLLMKDASEAVVPGFGRFTWKASKTGSKTVLDEVKLQKDYQDVYKACLKKIPTGGVRSFLIKPDKGDKEQAA